MIQMIYLLTVSSLFNFFFFFFFFTQTRFTQNKKICQIQLFQIWDKEKVCVPIPGGGDSIYKKGRDARQEFSNWPLRETNLGVARAFFDP